jgi:hypothetical protein
MIKPFFRIKRPLGVLGIVGLLGLLYSLGLGPAMAIEEPAFKTWVQEGAMEVRLYEPRLSAVTYLTGDMDQASNQGFRRIADFIFRNNTPAHPSGESLSTGPEKIAMTAPVIVQPQSIPKTPNTDSEYKSAGQWAVEFVMPKAYTQDNLPRPNNPEVEIKPIPAKTYAVLTYSGFNTEQRVQREIDALTAWIQTKGWQSIGPPQLARYDPPWTLPFWRRNEIWIELKPLP